MKKRNLEHRKRGGWKRGGEEEEEEGEGKDPSQLAHSSPLGDVNIMLCASQPHKQGAWLHVIYACKEKACDVFSVAPGDKNVQISIDFQLRKGGAGNWQRITRNIQQCPFCAK